MLSSEKNKQERPTIRAIAVRAGVSRATVSLILAGRHEAVSKFKPETVMRVREIAAAVGYKANLMAVSLRGERPSFFGLILRGAGKADAISWHHQAFEGQFLAGALEASRLLKLYPVLATQDSPDPDGAVETVRGILDGGLCGAILRTPVPVLDAPIQRLIEQSLPIVVIFPEHPATCPTNSIDLDNVAAGRAAGELLHGARRRRWVVIRDEMVWDAIRLREEGAVSVARDVGAHVDVLVTPAGMGELRTREWLVPRLKKLKPDGVYAAAAVHSVAALLACIKAGLRVPDKLSLVGCDASLWKGPGCPSITSVDVSWYTAGDLAVRKMAELSRTGEAVFPSIRLRPQVRKGETCPGGEEESAQVTVT